MKNLNKKEYQFAIFLIDKIYQSFELDVSDLSKQEINRMYNEKVLPENYKKGNIQSKKTLKKGVDIGN